ncbi:KTSC domain-containing protein [Salmonella enterica subsp. enterica serovar Newport]|nr:KTSC domain-containing protein [Salmonella enterica subsp. enterica serovar Newport]
MSFYCAHDRYQRITAKMTTSTLEIEFNSGAVWNYHDFPITCWYEFDGAESHGKFFHSFIKNNYRESQVG